MTKSFTAVDDQIYFLRLSTVSLYIYIINIYFTAIRYILCIYV